MINLNHPILTFQSLSKAAIIPYFRYPVAHSGKLLMMRFRLMFDPLFKIVSQGTFPFIITGYPGIAVDSLYVYSGINGQK
jgi:hypothetical protein